MTEAGSPFAHRIFRSVWIANLASNLGVLVQSVGASWLMVEFGASARMVALVQTSTSLPIVLFSLLGGSIADNRDRRKVMLAAQLFLLGVSAILAALTWAGWITPWSLIALTFLVGCGTAINSPAWQASVGDMVPRPALPNAVAFNAMGVNVARSLGPALGGAIVAFAGAAAAFAINAASSIGLIAVLAGWRYKPEPRSLPPERLHEAMAAGLRYVAMSPQLVSLMFRAGLFGITACAMLALMPLIARDLLGGGALTFGMMFGCFGLGAVLAVLGTGRLREQLSPDAIVRLCTVLIALGLLGASLSRHPVLTAPFLVLGGAGWVLAFSTINVSVQFASPRWVTARALSLYHMAVYAGVSLGSWLMGVCADRLDTASALQIAAGLNGFAMILGRLAPLAPLNRQSLDPADRWKVPATAIPVSDRSGPVVVEVEHRIAPDDTAAFLAVMDERRRIRKRDGARGWTLLRDVAEPELWVERYELPTWLDYVRHNQRRTKADEASNAAIHALQADRRERAVRRLIGWQGGENHAAEASMDDGLSAAHGH